MESVKKTPITFDKVSKERILELIRYGLYILCFVAIMIHLIEVDNSVFQTSKDTQNMIAMLFFAILICVVQRVKLFNLPSLLVTAVYGLLMFYQTRMYYQLVPDLKDFITAERVTVWILLMVVTDMVVTKRIRDFEKTNLPLLVLLASGVVLMFILSGGRYSVYNYVCVLLFFFVPFDGEEWNRIVRSLILAGFVSFVTIVFLSATINPLVPGERWYGSFLNIGAFGEFLGLITVLAVLSVIRVKRQFGRKNILYVLSWLWTLSVLAVVSLNGTTTYLLGAGMLIVVLLVFGGKKTEFPKLYIRILCLLALLLLGAISILFIARIPAGSFLPKDEFADGPIGSILQIALVGAYKVVDKLLSFHDLINGARADYIQSSALTFLHTFSSTRVGIFETFLRHTTFATGSGGLWYHGYFYPGAHNQFAQHLFEYGFLAGGLGILFFVSAWIGSIIGYVREKSNEYLAPMMLAAMMFGLWFGEVCTISYPIAFFALFLMAPVVIKPLPQRSEAIWLTSESLKGLPAKKRNGVLILSGCVLLLGLLFIGKLISVRKADVKDAEKYIVVMASEESSQGEENGWTLFDGEYAIANMKTAAWGGRGFAVIPFTGANTGDVLELKFSAVTEGSTPVRMKVCYEEEEEYVLVSDTLQTYSITYSGWPEDNNIVFVVEGESGMEAPVYIENVQVVDYGQ